VRGEVVTEVGDAHFGTSGRAALYFNRRNEGMPHATDVMMRVDWVVREVGDAAPGNEWEGRTLPQVRCDDARGLGGSRGGGCRTWERVGGPHSTSSLM
jgi:hypothetical protein